MSAKHHIDNENNLLFTVWEGDASESEFIDVLKKYQADIQCDPDYVHYNEVLDLGNAANIRVKISGLINIGHIASQTDHLFSNKKLAIVVSSNMVFGLIRIYEAYRNIGARSPKEMQVFKSKSKAIEWAKSDSW